MGRRVVPVLASVVAGGWKLTEPILFQPADGSNPENVNETNTVESFEWLHDATPSLLAADTYPMLTDYPEENAYITIHYQGTGMQVGLIYLSVNPAWCAAVIADKSIAQNGTLGNWDRYDLTAGDAKVTVTCDGLDYVLEGAGEDQGSYLLLWTANNALWASLYINYINADDDTAMMTKLKAANADLWTTNGFEVKLELY